MLRFSRRVSAIQLRRLGLKGAFIVGKGGGVGHCVGGRRGLLPVSDSWEQVERNVGEICIGSYLYFAAPLGFEL